MRVLRDKASIAQLEDPDLRALIEQRVVALAEDFDDYELHELVTFVVVEAGDSLQAIDEHLGFSILTRPFELLEEHPGWFEVVFVISDDGYGVEVFIPKHPDVPPELLSMCEVYSAHE